MKSARHQFFEVALLVAFFLGLSFGIQSGRAEDFGKDLKPEKVPDVGPCQDVELTGDRLYAIGRGTLYVLDSRHPDESPRLLGKLTDLGNVRQIVIREETAYITARQDGLWLVDVREDSAPKIISHYDTVEMATGIWVSGDVAFVATRQYGVEIIDVSDPGNPRHLSMLKTGEAQSCWGRDGILYIGDWAPRKMLVADVRDPLHPEIIGEALLDGFGDGGCLRENICFAATGHHSRATNKEEAEGRGHGLEIFNVSDPKAPVRISGVKFPASYHISNDMWSARVAGDHCIVSDTWNGLFVVNVTDLKNPKIVGHASLPVPEKREENDPVGGFAPGDGVIYAAGIFSGLYRIPAPGMSEPVIPEADNAQVIPEEISEAAPEADPDFMIHRPAGQVRSVTVSGDVAWAACGAAGIQGLRLEENGFSLLSHSRSGQGEVFHLAVTGDRLYAAESSGGLAIYRINEDFSLEELGRFRLPGQNVKQVTCPPPGRFALIHAGGARVWIVDVSNPAEPEVVFTDSQVGLFYGDQLVPEMLGGRYLVAHWHRSGPAWYDVASADQPKLLGNTPDDSLYSFTDGACALGDRLLITKRGRIKILDPGEMRNIAGLPSYGVEGRFLRGRPATNGKRLALSRRHEQLIHLLDISDPENPVFEKELRFSGHPGACGFWQDRLLVPAGYQGLLLEK